MSYLILEDGSEISANVLDNFATYAYYHILVACNNQAAVEQISAGTDISLFDTLHEFQTLADDPDDNDNLVPRYYVLINTMKDARLSIENVSWETVFGGSVNLSDQGNSLATAGEMMIREPRGFNFLNRVNDINDGFQSEPCGVTYLLKTIFIGHPSGAVQSNPPKVISNVAPLRFSIIDIKANFGVSGGSYDLRFVANTNGFARYPQMSRAAEGKTIRPKSLILKDVLNDLAAEINADSEQNYQRVVQAIKERLNKDSTIPATTAESLRRVKYVIDVDEHYDTDDYRVTEFNPRQTEDGTKESGGVLTWGRSFTVEQAIQDILKRTKKVQDELNKTNEAGVRYRYKIVSEVTMEDSQDVENSDTQGQTSNTESMVIRYTVRPYMELTEGILTKLLDGKANDADGLTANDIRNNLVVFDYFYTGKNTDILKFDITMQQGITFMQILTTTDNSMTAIEQQQEGTAPNKTVATNSITQKSVSQINKRIRTPVFPSTDVKDVLAKNVGDPLSTTSFNSALSKFASLEQLGSQIVIRGNPYMMGMLSKPAKDTNNPNNNGQEPSETTVMSRWDKIPSLIKVRIRMPVNSDNPSGKNVNGQSPKLEPFWYEGYYYILRMTHSFQGGEFTQSITMNSVVADDLFPDAADKKINDDQVVDEETTTDNIAQTDSDEQKSTGTNDRTANQRVKKTKQFIPSGQQRRQRRANRAKAAREQ